MSRKSRRELERELEKLREMLNDDNDDEIKFTSEVVTISDDMVDDNGTIESEVPDPTAPDGYELGDVQPTESPVVTVYELTEA
jgi:hypothetical protein